LTSSRPWRQVVSTNSWHQDVLSVKMSSSLRKLRQNVRRKSVMSRCRVRQFSVV